MSTATPILAGSPAAPSLISGCGPCVPLFDAFLPATIWAAISKTVESDEGADELGGRLWDLVRTEKEGVLSSIRACDRVPISQLVEFHNITTVIIAISFFCTNHEAPNIPVRRALCQFLHNEAQLIAGNVLCSTQSIEMKERKKE